jgi:hypothetical protein
LNFGSQLDCVKPDDPLSLNLKRKAGRQAGSSLLTPASHLPQILAEINQETTEGESWKYFKYWDMYFSEC